MNVEKLEAILREMREARFADRDDAQVQVLQWADRVGIAITEHLLESLGAPAAAPQAPSLSDAPGGHGWDDTGAWHEP